MKNNPWLGLATYDEEAIRQGYQFCGRERATKELYSIIDNNIITTLYGKSGIGKSSLLQAGLFPRLRTDNYLPVMVRLGIGEINDGYCETIISAVKSAIANIGGRCTGATPATNAEERLWQFFHSTEFSNSNGDIIFPIIVLDQFEELYFRDRQHLNTLLKAIYLLVDDTLLATSNDEAVINYRIVLSIREDDLFHLEDSIDKLRLTEMKYNRYRLRELSDEEARDIITRPGKALFAPDEAATIADTIIREAKSGSDEISTAVLSLICSRIYHSSAGQGHVTRASVESFFKAAEGNFLKSFYDDIIKELRSPAKWYYIEDALVTEEGRRNSVPRSEFYRQVPDASFLFKGEKSMLRYVTLPGNDEPRVEIIHDMLARQMLNSKKERKLQQQAAALRKQRLTAAAIILIIVAIGAAFFVQYRSIVEERNNMYKMQSRFIAEKAERLIGRGDNITAARLLLRVLPKKLNNPGRPYIEEAELALRKACDSIGSLMCILKHDNSVRSASFSPDGQFIVTVSNDSTAKIWNAETGEQVGETMKHEGGVNSASFSNDGKFIVTALWDNTAKIWNAQTGEQVGETMKHDKLVYSASFSNDGKFIVTASYDNTAKIWNAQTGKQVGETMKHDYRVNSASFSPDGQLIVTASWDKTARIWNAQTGEQVGETMKHDNTVRSASFSPDGQFIVTASDDNTAKIWNAQTGKQVGETMKHDKLVYSASFSPDGQFIVTASWDNTARIWNAQTGEQVGETMKHDKLVYSASFSNDGKFIVTASWDNTARIWNAQTGKQVGETMKHDNTVNSASFSNDGKFIVTASDDKTAKIWNAQTGKQVGETMKHDNSVYSASFSPDGQFIVTASWDKTARIWNAQTGKQVGETMKHDDWVNSASFSPDGKFIVTASWDNTAKIWNIQTGQHIEVIKHNDRVNSASFSNDGKYIVTASDDNTIKITEFIPLQDLLDKYNKLFEDWPLSEEKLKEYNFK